MNYTRTTAAQSLYIPQHPQRPQRPQQPQLLHPLNSSPQEILLVLDARGRIQYCGNQNSFLSNHQAVAGTSISTLIPSLPLRSKTPGYNIAYVRLSFADDAWQRHTVVNEDGDTMPVDIHLRTIAIERGFCLIGLLRLPVDAHREAEEAARRGNVANGAWRIDAVINSPAREHGARR